MDQVEREVEAMVEIEDMIVASELGVLAKFSGLPNAVFTEDMDYVFIPGSREPRNRVLFVAHCDTVWAKPVGEKDIQWLGNMLVATWANKQGIGADDRVGCAAAMRVALRGEHSVLITTGEECGAVGAQVALMEIKAELKEHAFALQIDRRGDQEIALYSGGFCDEWEEWLEGRFVGWNQTMGTFTDITVLCDDLGICGANLAAGYIYEHTQRETFFLDAWFRTWDAVEALLNLESYPAYKPDKVVYGGGFGSMKWWNTTPLPNSGSVKVDDSDMPWWETYHDNDQCVMCDKVLIEEASVKSGICYRCRLLADTQLEEQWPEEIISQDDDITNEELMERMMD